MSIRENIEAINEAKSEAAIRSGRNPEDILLIAVTKLHDASEINEAIDCGITDIGENKVQEILDKYEKVKKVRWHLIGHLQTNKVKYIIDKVDLIHSVDSLKLAEEIEKRSANIGKTMDILIQVNAAEEESKFGVSVSDVDGLIESILQNCPHIRIKGLMTIGPFVDDDEEIRRVFKEVSEIFDRYKGEERENLDFQYLSMGMTHDFEIAIEEGANCIRVGTAIFGDRDYRKEEK